MTEKPTIEKRSFRITRIKLLILLVVVLLIPLMVYLGMSYTSVEGTTIKLTAASRGGMPYFVNSFNITVYVYSSATSLNMRVDNPVFVLSADSYYVGTVSAASGTWKPYGSMSYNLQFKTTDYAAGTGLAKTSANQLLVSMSATVSGGIYLETVTRFDSSTFKFA
ncbi:MAG TPA: hypothetical protein VFE98_10020 [Candidatus Bathyarchaeia archaeon]|nr:hypothetical protein [Candidatus Bathyarchaeia archaeon]